ncbi:MULTISPECIES: hypothetical protein [Pseudofrankia]|uniref:hypothetical protein n=1 Tax=Pseudofrankia TaxID=2994363 RepID=UPI000234CD03|nr:MULTISPECIES: hypothetical protein [Pseudofrankia]OHV33378.1 hypothetical protein BCD49_27320 [Pseudofrankia sp. EUN1h]
MPEHENIDEAKPWLVIPYFAGDLGRQGIERAPLPPPALGWLCEGIRVNGGPLRVYNPGEPTTVTVDVRNYGGGAAETLATVTVWWTDPTAGFSSAKWFGEEMALVASKGGSATATVTGVIPVTAPAHVCLLASVEAAFDDNLPATIAPGVDRHWAQLNIDAVKAPGGAFRTPFAIGNPGYTRIRTHVSARLLSPERSVAAAKTLGVAPFHPKTVELKLSARRGEARLEHLDGAVAVDLAPGRSATLELAGHLSPPPEPGTAALIEIVQYAPHDPDTVVGSLAVAVTGG